MKIKNRNIRNVAIIAHVDHGKTTLVDRLFDQSGMFHEKEKRTSRLMDSMDLEKERGITISSKNGSFSYKDHRVNIIDTPGHADFGGQVERVLRMADGVLLLVDAKEGPMPQTRFVMEKTLALKLPVVVVINKIDKEGARHEWVLGQVFDLFAELHAPDDILDFPVVYANAKAGYAGYEPDEIQETMKPVYDTIIEKLPPPEGNPDSYLQMLVSSIDYSPYLGRLGIGKITSGRLRINSDIGWSDREGKIKPARITKLYHYLKNEKVPVEEAVAGDIVAVAGTEDITVGVTLIDPGDPHPLPPPKLDPPTISMNFLPNDSPFAGNEGEFVTPRHLEDRLMRETLSDVALSVAPAEKTKGFKVSGRGELHLTILIETMRREGYEFQVSRPEVIFREKNGKRQEPFEDLSVEVHKDYSGSVIEKLGKRYGEMLNMEQDGDIVYLKYKIPARGLLGYRSEFLTDTRGTGILSYVFKEYDYYAGDIITRTNGALIVKEPCTSVAYALFNLQNRGRLFIGPGERLYKGQIVGEHNRSNDLVVNPAKGKKLTNMRSAGSDENVILTPPAKMTIEDKISWIRDGELVEVTPKNIRLRSIKT